MFEGNVKVYPIHCLQASNYNWLTFISNIFLAKDDFLCHCNAPPTTVGCHWIMFEGYLDLGLKHPKALGEVY
jgi:hypothetical protein